MLHTHCKFPTTSSWRWVQMITTNRIRAMQILSKTINAQHDQLCTGNEWENSRFRNNNDNEKRSTQPTLSQQIDEETFSIQQHKTKTTIPIFLPHLSHNDSLDLEPRGNFPGWRNVFRRRNISRRSFGNGYIGIDARTNTPICGRMGMILQFDECQHNKYECGDE